LCLCASHENFSSAQNTHQGARPQWALASERWTQALRTVIPERDADG